MNTASNSFPLDLWMFISVQPVDSRSAAMSIKFNTHAFQLTNYINHIFNLRMYPKLVGTVSVHPSVGLKHRL